MSRRWGKPGTLTLAILLVLTALVTWFVRDIVGNQEDRLLKERTNEVGVVLKEAVDSLGSQLQSISGVVRATDAAPRAFERSAAPLSRSSGVAVTLYQRTGAGWSVSLVSGHGLHPGEAASGLVAQTLTRATSAKGMVPTPVIGEGADRAIGFALDASSGQASDVLYLQLRLGPLGPPMSANTEPFHEVHVALYAAATTAPSQAVVSTAAHLPLSGDVRTVRVAAGAGTWTLQVTAVHPLVGATTADAPWLAAAIGTLLAILLALVVETETRRRRSAVALYQGEHALADALQQMLLPRLPSVPSVELGAHYLSASSGRQVGGDWYDLFELESGQLGLVIGDVVGHDMDAAALMSQIQSALRAYAYLGRSPGAVLAALEGFLAATETERLATVFYAVLGSPAADGSRELIFANAGHLPPLLATPEGEAAVLDQASSTLLGTGLGGTEPRAEHTMRLSAGSTLLLYTDGLVEIPRASLSARLDELKAHFEAGARSQAPGELCAWLAQTMLGGQRNDDVAVLAVKI